MREISGCRLPYIPATLHGYTRRAVRGATYPGIFSDVGGLVLGCLYQDLPDTAWAPLDRFEGEMYVREQVQIALENASVLAAEVYVVRPEFLHRLDTMDWDFDAFLHRYDRSGISGICWATEL